MIEIGKVNKLKIVRETTAGLHLSDDDKNEVLLPASLAKATYKVKDDIEVFIYTDGEARLIATTAIPYAQLNSFAYLRVTSITQIGAFIDWGLEKDLLLPFNEQKIELEEGDF